MSVSANTSNQGNLFKRLWGNKVADPMYKASRFLSLVKKDTNFGGEGRYVIVDIAPTAGGSASFSEALANQDATVSERFFVTHRKEYQVFSIQGDLIARSKGDKNAVVESLKHQADKARYAFSRSMARRAWGHAGGSLGQISATSNVATGTIRLANRTDVVNFDKGMWVTLASDNGSAASPAGTRDSGKKVQIGSVNRATGDLTLVSGNWNQVIGAAANDFIHRAGDYALAMTGAQGWAPVSDPSPGESFFGVDRTTKDVVRTSGIRVAGNGGVKVETLINATAEGHLNGVSMQSHCFTNPLDYRDIAKERESVRQIDGTAREAGIGFKALEVIGNTGSVTVVSETDVPKGFFWLLDVDEVYLRTAGDAPMMLNEDGVGRLLRSATDDAYEGRLGCYGNFFWENPGHVIIGTF